ncbi:hypothetical protein [Spirillospora sp. CA-294931]|uniref:hypothetical protein n=1 Tax=Spirillospora sp. CA-294931 TaxID=3240042 RepID=UPI003D8F0341
MKFELVEPPEPAVPETVEDEAGVSHAPEGPGDDPVAGIEALTSQFVAEVAVAAEGIDASLAELAEVVQSSQTDAVEWDGAAPPENFRAGRFGRRAGE